MADDDETTTTEDAETAAPATTRKRRTRKAAPAVSAKLEARGRKISETIREVSGWIRRHAPQEELGFADTIDRDAEKIGGAIAALGNRFRAVGRAMDLLFGEGGPLSILVALSPSIRAGRRSLAERRTLRREQRAQAKLENVDEPANRAQFQTEEEWLAWQREQGL